MLTIVMWIGLQCLSEAPRPTSGDFVVREFRFADGATLPELRLHYRTVGTPRRDEKGTVRNAVLVLHGTTGNGEGLLRPEFADELWGKGQPLDAATHFIILPDGIGNGKSSKPSDGLRAKFPRYGYRDMVQAQHRLLTDGLNVNHLRLIVGTSMGGMHAWLWGQMCPDLRLPALASLPTQISPHRGWHRSSARFATIPGARRWYAKQPRSARGRDAH